MRSRCVAAFVVIVCVTTPLFAESVSSAGAAPQIGALPFGGSPNPWNTAIRTQPVLDPASSAMVSSVSGQLPVADLYSYGVPIFDAWAGTARASVTCTARWGRCTLSTTPIPIPANARPSSGSDRAMVVIDHVAQVSYEFWQARKVSASTWATAWGGIVPLNGPGTPGVAVGSGVSRLAGVVRADEIASGQINHALAVSSSETCASFRYPATKSDGGMTGPSCLPEGARIQLDPLVDVAALPGLTVAERTVARALQTYGAYVVDTGAAPLAIVFQDPIGIANPYPAAGLNADYARLGGIPWSRLRVLAAWSGN